MQHASHSVLLPYCVADVFTLVASVDRYKEFLPWCKNSTVLQNSCDELLASMRIVVAGHDEEMVTSNKLQRNERIVMSLVRGPFHRFEGVWRFVDLGEGCRVTLDVSFELDSIVLSTLAYRLKDRAIEKVIDAFASRARSTIAP